MRPTCKDCMRYLWAENPKSAGYCVANNGMSVFLITIDLAEACGGFSPRDASLRVCKTCYWHVEANFGASCANREGSVTSSHCMGWRWNRKTEM